MALYVKKIDLKEQDSSLLAIFDCIVETYEKEVRDNHSNLYLQIFDVNYDLIDDEFDGTAELIAFIELRDDSYKIMQIKTKSGNDLENFTNNSRKFRCINPK